MSPRTAIRGGGTYLYANDWKYWTMGTPVEQTILINRTNQEIDGGPLRRPGPVDAGDVGRDRDAGSPRAPRAPRIRAVQL